MKNVFDTIKDRLKLEQEKLNIIIDFEGNLALRERIAEEFKNGAFGNSKGWSSRPDKDKDYKYLIFQVQGHRLFMYYKSNEFASQEVKENYDKNGKISKIVSWRDIFTEEKRYKRKKLEL